MTSPALLNSQSSPAQVRAACRAGEWTGPTCGLAVGFQHANLVILPKEFAFDFLLFCHRNPQPCPLLDVTDPGDPEPKTAAPGADLRTDLPRYAVFQDGELIDRPTDIMRWWREDMVAFLLGCSFSFEAALLRAGLPVRHLEEQCNVPMFKTNIPNQRAGIFQGELVVSMRPFSPDFVERVRELSARMPWAHGAPVHHGNPTEIGIHDLQKPDFGDAVTVNAGEVPVFWACGVTPQAAIMSAKPPLAITHLPGCMCLTDLSDSGSGDARVDFRLS